MQVVTQVDKVVLHTAGIRMDRWHLVLYDVRGRTPMPGEGVVPRGRTRSCGFRRRSATRVATPATACVGHDVAAGVGPNNRVAFDVGVSR